MAQGVQLFHVDKGLGNGAEISGVRKTGWFPKGWFWLMFPLPKFAPNSLPFSATLSEESYDFDMPGPQKLERGHIRLLQNRPYLFPPDYNLISRLFFSSLGCLSTAVAEIITELIRFEPEVCICNRK